MTVGTLGLVLACVFAHPADTLVTVRSRLSPAESGSRLEMALDTRQLTLFARIDHAANARQVDDSLRPTVVYVFGNPRAGTAIMRCRQEIGIDLPLRILIWRDEAGATWIGYEDPRTTAARRGVTGCGPVLQRMAEVMAALAKEASGDG